MVTNKGYGKCEKCDSKRTCNSLDKSRGMLCKDFQRKKNSKMKRGTADVEINDISKEVSGTRI